VRSRRGRRVVGRGALLALGLGVQVRGLRGWLRRFRFQGWVGWL
jgi:hypothetical protein